VIVFFKGQNLRKGVESKYFSRRVDFLWKIFILAACGFFVIFAFEVILEHFSPEFPTTAPSVMIPKNYSSSPGVYVIFLKWPFVLYEQLRIASLLSRLITYKIITWTVLYLKLAHLLDIKNVLMAWCDIFCVSQENGTGETVVNLLFVRKSCSYRKHKLNIIKSMSIDAIMSK